MDHRPFHSIHVLSVKKTSKMTRLTANYLRVNNNLTPSNEFYNLFDHSLVTFVCILASCLALVACVSLNRAFPFDLTQFYNTVHKSDDQPARPSSPSSSFSSINSMSFSNDFAARHTSSSSLVPYSQPYRPSSRRKKYSTSSIPTETLDTSTVYVPTTTTATSMAVTITSTITSTTSTSTTTTTTRAPTKQSSTTSSPSSLPKSKGQKASTTIKPISSTTPKPKTETPQSKQVKDSAVSIPVKSVPKRKFSPFPMIKNITVDTTNGPVIGMIGNIMGRDVAAFLGVPFATPPIGKLRFKKTTPAKSWTTPYLAHSFKPHCIQEFSVDVQLTRTLTTHNMSEDCLYLNIWSPDLEDSSEGKVSSGNQLKPIMIWVPGSGFKSGTSNFDETDGRALASLGNVVVVTINYRVGSLGFLDLAVEESPGNQGLYDILTAITFVKNNAQNFGGNPNSITLFGSYSGAISIGILITSPMARGLVTRAILQSGSPLFQEYFADKNLKSSEVFLRDIGCSNCFDLKQKFTCLRSKSTIEILNVQSPLLKHDAHIFGPTICESLIPIAVADAITSPSRGFNVKQLLIGSNRDELSLSLILDYPDLFTPNQIKVNITTLRELRNLVIKLFSSKGPTKSLSDKASIQYLAEYFFTGGAQTDLTENLIQKMYRVFGDAAVTCPVNILAEEFIKSNKANKLFLYEFNHRPSNSPYGQWMGVPLSSEIAFIFGHPLRYPNTYSKYDLAMSKRMINTWSHFASTGTVPLQLNQTWEPFTGHTPDFLDLNPREVAYGNRQENEVCKLFRMAFESRNETSTRIDCDYKLIDSYSESTDEVGPGEDESTSATTVDPNSLGTESTDSVDVTTQAPLITCPLFAEDIDGPIIDYLNYQVIDFKIIPVPGSRVVFKCEYDHRIVGEPVSTCTEFGNWTSDLPKCEKIPIGVSRNDSTVRFTCDFFNLTFSPLLHVTYDNLFYLNDTFAYALEGSLAKFSCNKSTDDPKIEIALVGSSLITCNKYGIWSSILPSCERVPETKIIYKRDFKRTYFVISLILVFLCASCYISYNVYTKLSKREVKDLPLHYSPIGDVANLTHQEKNLMKQQIEFERQEEKKIYKKSIMKAINEDRKNFNIHKEECQLLQANREFYTSTPESCETGQNMSDILTPEDLEIMRIFAADRRSKLAGQQTVQIQQPRQMGRRYYRQQRQQRMRQRQPSNNSLDINMNHRNEINQNVSPSSRGRLSTSSSSPSRYAVSRIGSCGSLPSSDDSLTSVSSEPETVVFVGKPKSNNNNDNNKFNGK